jgi:hypothetical protein
MLHETSFQEITQENGELKVLKEKKRKKIIRLE